MSWDFAVIAIRGDVRDRTGDLFEEMGLGERSPAGAISFDEATSMDPHGVAVAYTGEWTVLTGSPYFAFVASEHEPGPEGFFPPSVSNTLAALSADQKVWGFVLDGTVLANGFVTYTDGAVQRSWFARQDTTLVDHGSPVPAEQDVEDGTAYEKVRAILRETVGSTEEFVDLQWTVYS